MDFSIERMATTRCNGVGAGRQGLAMDRGCVAGASDLDEMIFAFDLQGYVILKSVISPERLATMNALIDSQVQQPARPPKLTTPKTREF